MNSLRKRIIFPLLMAGLILFGIGSYFVGNLEARQKLDAVVQEAEAMQNHLQSVLDTHRTNSCSPPSSPGTAKPCWR